MSRQCATKRPEIEVNGIVKRRYVGSCSMGLGEERKVGMEGSGRKWLVGKSKDWGRPIGRMGRMRADWSRGGEGDRLVDGGMVGIGMACRIAEEGEG